MWLVRCTNQTSNVCSVDHSVSFSVFFQLQKRRANGMAPMSSYKNQSSSYQGKFQWIFDQGKGNLARAGGIIEVSEFVLLGFFCTYNICKSSDYQSRGLKRRRRSSSNCNAGSWVLELRNMITTEKRNYCFSVTSNSTAGFKRRLNRHPFHFLSLRLCFPFTKNLGSHHFCFGRNKPMKAHVWTCNRIHQSAIVLVRCVSGSSSYCRHTGKREDPGDEVDS